MVDGFFEPRSEERRGVSSSGETSSSRVVADITGEVLSVGSFEVQPIMTVLWVRVCRDRGTLINSESVHIHTESTCLVLPALILFTVSAIESDIEVRMTRLLYQSTNEVTPSRRGSKNAAPVRAYRLSFPFLFRTRAQCRYQIGRPHRFRGQMWVYDKPDCRYRTAKEVMNVPVIDSFCYFLYNLYITVPNRMRAGINVQLLFENVL